MQSVDLKKRRRAVKIANAVNSIEGVPACVCDTKALCKAVAEVV